MTVRMPSYQRGFDLGQFLFIAILFVLVSITGLKLIPPYMESGKIQNIFTNIAHDPDMQKVSPSEIRKAFQRRASVDDVSAIQASDIEIGSEGGKPTLSASYSVTIPLVSNISFYLEFNPSSE